MAILSNINGKFAVDSTGAVQFSGAAGTSGYILKSNGAGSAPTWVDSSTVIGGPYLPLSGGTLTGATATASGISFTFGGTARFDGDMTLPAAADNFDIGFGLQTTGKIRFGDTSWNNSLGLESYWMVLRTNQNEGLKLIDSAGNTYVQFNASNNSAGAYVSTFTGNITSTGATITLDSSGSAGYIADRANDTSGATYEYKTNGSLKWYTGSRGVSTEDFYLFNNAQGSTALLFNSSNNNATFAGEIINSMAAPKIQLRPTTQNNASIIELGVLNAGTNAYARIDAINLNNYDTNLRFWTNAAGSTTQVERMRINSSGNVHIVNGRLDLSDGSVYDSSVNAGSTLYLNCDADNNSTGEKVVIGHGAYGTGSSAIAVFQENGNVSIGATSSSSKLKVEGPNTPSNPLVDLVASGTGSWQRGVRLLNGGMNAGDEIMYAIGRSDNSRNMGQTYFYYAGNGSTSNRISMGLHSVDDVFNIVGTGNVGIGTTSPAQKLDVNGNIAIRDTFKIFFNHNTNTGRYIGASSANDIEIASDDDIVYRSNYNRFFNVSTEFARLSGSTNSWIANGSNGKLGINKTNPAYNLDVTGSIYCTASYVRASTAPDIWYSNNNTDTYTQTVLYMNQSNSSNTDSNGYFLERGRISNSSTAEIRRWVVGARGGQKQMVLDGPGTLTVAGDVVAYGSPSDISLKENIKPIKNPLGKIKKLKGVTFDSKQSNSILDIKEDYGFIAQDVQKIIPELVRKNENELLSMRHQGIIPILVEAIKELEARVKELENK